jgi:hypothetical protein
MPYTLFKYAFEDLWNRLRTLISNALTDYQWTLENEAGQEVAHGNWETIGSVTEEANKISITCTLRDTSSATYTFRTVVVWCDIGGTRARVCEYDFGSNITKGADQTLKIDVKISLSPILI